MQTENTQEHVLLRYRFGGDSNLKKLCLSTQYWPGSMEAGEAGAMGLYLKNKQDWMSCYSLIFMRNNREISPYRLTLLSVSPK